MRKLLLILSLFFCLFQSKAQNRRWAVTFTPALAGNTSLQFGIQPGAIYKWNDKWELLTEITFIPTLYTDSSTLDPSYFRIKPEIRYMLSGHSRTKWYAGLQASYVFRKWRDGNGGGYFEESLFEDSSISYSSARIKSPVFSASAQTGLIFRLGHHFGIDVFMGWGVRVINTSYTEVANKGKVYSPKPNCKIFISPDPAYWVNGNVTRVHFNSGLRFLYKF